MPAVIKPDLPEKLITTALCGDCAMMQAALRERGIAVIESEPCNLLPEPVSRHADLICRHIGSDKVITADRRLADALTAMGFDVRITESEPGNKYPFDCLLNCLIIGRCAFCRVDSVDAELKRMLAEDGIKLVNVRQGYTRCSTAVVDERSLITADRGIAAALIGEGFDVLVISPGDIILEGYDTGFIGGCCGKISADRMLFRGDVSTHPDGHAILEFLAERGVSAECIGQGKLIDFGGFVPLCE